ncbi:MAG: flagellar hook-associated protein 2 [Bacillales bacterium]|nr:flagellar hook-associated protein 2 [Bacillales bacterium]
MVTRITGLASGMDIDSMVKQLMTAAKVPLDKLKQQKQILEWQRDDYRDMNSALLDFRSLLTQMKLTTNYRARQVTSSDDTKVTATASSAAGLTSYSISKVTQLASAATVTANNSIAADPTKFDPTTSLQDQAFVTSPNWKQGGVATKSITVTADGTTFQLGETNFNSSTFSDWNVKVNGQTYNVVTDPNATLGDKDVYVYVDENGNAALKFKNPLTKDSTIKVDYITTDSTQKYSVFSIDSWTSKGEVTEKFLVQGSDSLNTVINKVNSSSAGVNMFYDSFSGKMSVVRTETGKFNPDSTKSDLQITGEFAKALSLDTSDATTLDTSTNTYTGTYVRIQEGQNAKFTLNGLDTERNSNTFTVNGVNFTLKQTFDGPVSVSVTNDSDTVYKNIKDFIDKYNDLIDKISKKTSEERYRDYPPLTDDQREQLTDKQQEQWDEKAKSGLLRNDPILTGLLSKMRTNFYSTVQNDSISTNYNQIAKIGITTSSNFLDGGKLIIDEAKLKQAIQNDPTSVENLFRGDGGIVQQLYDTVNNAMNQLKDKAGNSYSTNQQFSIGRQLDDINNRVNDMQSRLDDLENRYYNQFNAMEQAIQQANQQSLYLTQMLSGGK